MLVRHNGQRLGLLIFDNGDDFVAKSLGKHLGGAAGVRIFIFGRGVFGHVHAERGVVV